MARKRLPPPNKVRHALHGLAINHYAVGSWCPTPDGTGPATAVALTLTVVGLVREHRVDLVMRLKNPAAVDTMIQSLLRHKRDVWPDAS